MLRASDISELIWRIYTFVLVFTVFLSFSTENASGGFYPKYYAFLLGLCILSVLPVLGAFIGYLKANVTQVALFLAFLGTMLVWNFIVSGFAPFYSIVVLITATVGATIFVLGRIRRRIMTGIVRAVIIINVLALVYQFLIFGLTGDVPYIHADLFTFSRGKYMLVILGGFERFTGLQMEPGSYSTMIALALILYRSLTGKVDRVFIAGTISVMMTFATVAIIYFAILSFVIAREVKWSRPQNFFLALAGVLGVFAVLVLGGIIESILSRFDGGYQGDSSLNVKVLNLISYTQFSAVEFLSGLGFETIDRDCLGCNYVKSNGLLFYMVYSLGIMGFFFIIGFVLKSLSNGLVCLSLVILVLLCRYPPIVPVFWVVFLSLWTWPKTVPHRKAHPRRPTRGGGSRRGRPAYASSVSRA